MNKSKGVIRFDNPFKYSEQQITTGLSHYIISEVHQLTKKIDNNNRNRPVLFVLTFDTQTWPERVRIGWTVCEIRRYIPRPRRCFNCQRYDHGGSNCRAAVGTCAICGAQTHGDCNADPRFANCSGNQPVYSTECATCRYEE